VHRRARQRAGPQADFAEERKWAALPVGLLSYFAGLRQEKTGRGNTVHEGALGRKRASCLRAKQASRPNEEEGDVLAYYFSEAFF
jgi:hypothetical protein